MLASWAGKMCGVQRLESAGLDYAHMLLPAASRELASDIGVESVR